MKFTFSHSPLITRNIIKIRHNFTNQVIFVPKIFIFYVIMYLIIVRSGSYRSHTYF